MEIQESCGYTLIEQLVVALKDGGFPEEFAQSALMNIMKDAGHTLQKERALTQEEVRLALASFLESTMREAFGERALGSRVGLSVVN